MCYYAQMQTLIGITGIGLLVAIGFGVFRIYGHTSAIFDVMQDNLAAAAEQMAQLTGQVEEDESDYGTNPIGFHSPTSKRN